MVASLASLALGGYGGRSPRLERRLTLLPPPTLEDAELVAAMADGDRSALASLYTNYAGVMLAIGVRILRDRSEAEELLHEVFVEAFRAASAYDPRRGSVRTWLTLRMRSRCLDRVKSAGRSRRVALDDVAPARMVAPAETGSGDERRVAEALAALPPDQRTALELAYFEGLSSTEIAARLGVPVGTVKSRTAAAIARLRVAMGAT